MNSKELKIGTKVKLKAISDYGRDKLHIHGKEWTIDKIVPNVNNKYQKDALLLVLKSNDLRNVCIWYDYENDSNLRIEKFF